jgi:hypothetical protein
MKHLTSLTCSRIVAFRVAVMNPPDRIQTGKRFPINDTAGPAERWNNSPVTEAE